MADLDHEDDEFLVLDIADDAVVADPVALVGPQRAAVMRLTKASGILVCGKVLLQKRHDPLCVFLPAYRS
jgi:hypothetical protein